LDGPDYELAWPRDLFVAEASALVASGHDTTESRVELLLEEAFVSSTPAEDFKAAPQRAASRRGSSLWDGRPGDDNPWATEVPEPPVVAQADFLAELIKRAEVLREASAPRPYWPERNAGVGTPRQALSVDEAKRRFAGLIGQLDARGYLEKVFPRGCVDEPHGGGVNESAKLQELLGTPGLWPLRPGQWDDDTFHGLVEVFHDLVVRPRDRWLHSFGGCGWHYSAFTVSPARMLYRRQVNKILADADVPLRLAEEGEDVGRLVHLVDDGRRELLERAVHSPDPKAGDQVRHAIALFRGRTATVQDKRSAVVTLAHVLERRRQLLKVELLRGDEGALFHIANEFAIRHESERQKAHYDPVFLDWVFWWYLATVELTDRLLARGAP
jgi:hypothetical protein